MFTSLQLLFNKNGISDPWEYKNFLKVVEFIGDNQD